MSSYLKVGMQPTDLDRSFFAQPDVLAAGGSGYHRTPLFQGDAATMGVVAGPPAEVPLHLHREHDEFGYLISGVGRLRIGDATYDVEPGSAWGITRGTPHGAVFATDYRLLSWFTPADDPLDPDRVVLAAETT